MSEILSFVFIYLQFDDKIEKNIKFGKLCFKQKLWLQNLRVSILPTILGFCSFLILIYTIAQIQSQISL